MPQYAAFDHTQPAPQPVIGWYDTDRFKYKSPPDAADLLELTPEQWSAHFAAPSHWQVNDGVLEAIAPPVPVEP
jgi:hypothetical protein